MITYKDWLREIRKIILKKYGVINPTFIINEEIVNPVVLCEWLKKSVQPPIFWVKYKKLSDDQFELKMFSPDPSDEISEQIIFDYLNKIPASAKNKMFMLNYPGTEGDIILGDSQYDEDEIKRELLYLFRTGLSKISLCRQPEEQEDKVVYHLLSGQDSLENMLKSGYLQLEYFD